MFYLELFDGFKFDTQDVVTVLVACIDWCMKQDEVPGVSPSECGNYKSHDLIKAKEWLARYKQVLVNNNAE